MATKGTAAAGKPVRVIARAVAVLRALDGREMRSLAELHAATGLPKPTLLRLLGALEAEQLVWRAMADGRYRSRVAIARAPPIAARHARLAAVAAPHLAKLNERVFWPSDLAVRAGLQITLLETSRRESRFLMHRDPLGTRIDLLLSAAGRAVLAYLPPAERDRLLDALTARPSARMDRAPVDRPAVLRMLAQTRSRGYAVRDPSFGGVGLLREERDDKLAAIAVPVLGRGRVIGSLNLVWPRHLQNEATLARRHLPLLREAADAIAGDFLAPAKRG